MRVVIVGVPGVGKKKLAQNLNDKFPELQGPIGNASDLINMFGDDLSVGEITDYRAELAIAVSRAFAMIEVENGIFTGTLIDSVANMYTRYSIALQADALQEDTNRKWWLTCGTLYAILIDSFAADKVFFIPAPKSQILDPFIAELDSFYPQILEQFAIDYVTLDQEWPDLRSEVAIAVMGQEASESNSGTEQSIEEDSI